MTHQYRRRFIAPLDQYRRWIDPRLGQLRLTDVTDYLRRHGWVEVPSDRPSRRVFREPAAAEDDPLYQFVPDAEGSDDFATRMFELVSGIAEFEGRYAGAVIDDIVSRRPAPPLNGNGSNRPADEMASRDAPG